MGKKVAKNKEEAAATKWTIYANTEPPNSKSKTKNHH
jgi:hypothetical protein